MTSGKELGETLPLSASASALLRRQAMRSARVLLVVYHRDGAEAAPLIPGHPVVVGREPPADLAVEDASLSRRHARFTSTGDAISVEDLGSTNGTWVRGERIDQGVVGPGDEVWLGGVAASLQLVDPASEGPLGLEGHERFLAHVEQELVRARYFGRKTALLFVRGSGAPPAPLPRWAGAVQATLRPVDRVGLYGASWLEVLLPEVDETQALALAQRAGFASPDVVAGFAVFPDTARDTEELVERARGAAQQATRQARVVSAAGAVRTHSTPPTGVAEGPVAASPPMRALFDTVQRVARSAIPVLLHGETGVGKEVVARALHDGSPRASRPLLFVNCGAIPSQLVESTLFGHERGAFTGAMQQHRGVFEAAHGGTVLLDELGELPPPAQAALLRVLETKRITRVGSTKEIDVDVRLLAATNRDLEAMSATGAFRLDLLYRLNAMTLTIPPLRDRREDIAPLCARFLAEANRNNGRSVRGFDPEAIELCERYAWPGNVRELRNAVERAVVVAQGEVVGVEDLPDRVRAAADSVAEPARASTPAPVAGAAAGSPKARVSTTAPGEPPADFRAAVQRYEVDLIVAALRASSWNQTAAAKRLDMPLRTLLHKMKTLGIKKLGYGDGPG